MSMSSKTTQFSLELFSYVKQLAGLIEGQLDLGHTVRTTDRQVLKNTYLHKYVLERVSFGSKDCTKELKLESLPKIPTLVGPFEASI